VTRRQGSEVAIGLTQIVGQYLGSTTIGGAVVYETVTLAWWVWMLTGRMWGFLPLNVAGAIVSTVTLWRLLS
jgi:hypothetical protein